ncbi:MAG TPA: translational GTPase TypA [Chloroflexia bacterium]|nr:translational GTPase TypA [Chloroflexia bacterium]
MSHVSRDDIRNVAIIAHVDHGKTTLVDGLLKQSNIFRKNEAVGNLIMDSNDLEREKGITILAKNTAVIYKGVKINIIDTPGHADFGGEVERVLNMADGCLLLIDSVDGPMPQTRFVLSKAFEMGLKPIVVINKIDRPTARPETVLNMTQDLFLELATDSEQLDFPVVYAIAKEGKAAMTAEETIDATDLAPLFETILQYVPAPLVEEDAPLQMLVTSLDYNSHLGRIGVGRVTRGVIKAGSPVSRITRDGKVSRQKITQLFTFQGLGRREIEEASAGDLIAFAGVSDVSIGETIADAENPEALPPIDIEEPTLQLTFGVNTSPFGGREGNYSTSRQLRERLYRELDTNIALRVQDTDQADVFLVSGRGELHLSILIETMRREGYEFQVSRPEVITKTIEGRTMEPVEHLIIDTDEEYEGAVIELLGRRKAQMVKYQPDGKGRTRLEFSIPTRGLIGFRNVFLTSTRGNGTMASLFTGYEPWYGDMGQTRNGVLVASDDGVATTYGLANAQERGQTFIEPTTPIYEGMIVGLNSREQDIPVNVAKEKKLTNIRSSTSDIAVRLTPPVVLSLEQSLDFIESDELVEVTPKNIRLRKRILNHGERIKFAKNS